MNFLIDQTISQIEVHHRKIFIFAISGFIGFIISLPIMVAIGAPESYQELAVVLILPFFISCGLWFLKYSLIIFKRSIEQTKNKARIALLKTYAFCFIFFIFVYSISLGANVIQVGWKALFS